MFNRQSRREEVTAFFAALPPCLVGMEACGGSHYWAREISRFGHDVKLLHPRRVKPFVINNKTDAADARAICEVVRRPDIDFVNVKTVGQQHLSASYRVRERLIGNRTALANQIRGLLHEEGVILPQGIAHLRNRLPGLIETSSQLHEASRILFMELHAELIGLDTKIEAVEKKMGQMAKADAHCSRLMEIPGVGMLTATAIVAHFGDAKQFRSARQFAACIGSIPRECSSGGKQKLLGISKRGNTYIRKLLIQGARMICMWWDRKKASSEEWRKLWLQQLTARRGRSMASVAQANETARIPWHVLARGAGYDPSIGRA